VPESYQRSISSPSVDLDLFAPRTDIDGKRQPIGGYCGPAVKPIALTWWPRTHATAATADMPIKWVIGAWTTHIDAQSFSHLGPGDVQVLYRRD